MALPTATIVADVGEPSAASWWDAAIRHVIDDPDGSSVRRSQALWARAVHAELDGAPDVTVAGDVFGPALTPGGRVLMRPVVGVRSADPARTRDACDVAWRRFTLVDHDGVEVDAEWSLGVPDPVAYPHVMDGVVVLGFDAGEDEEPYPHRARTCLRILVEELRRHGCVPAQLVNVAGVPDDDGVDVEALADQLPDLAAVAPSASSGSGDDRPGWLPAFHRIDRTTVGSPSGPVPFLLRAAGWAFAWDTEAGLLKLPDRVREDHRRVIFPMHPLTPDGTRMWYWRYYLAQDVSGLPSGRVAYHLASGEAEVMPVAAGEVYEAGPHGPYLYRIPFSSSDWRTRYEVVTSPDASPLVFDTEDPLVSNHDGAAAQFSPDGRQLLTSHQRVRSQVGQATTYLLRTDLRTGRQRTYEDVRLAGSASWDPTGTRCLVGHGSARWVLDLDSEETTPVPAWHLGPGPLERRSDAEAIAWLGADGFLTTQRYGRRIELAYQPLDGSARYPVLDLPIPGGARNFMGVIAAADVVHRTPWLVGRRQTTP